MADKFTVHTEDEQTDLLASHLPRGEALNDRYVEDSVLRNLLNGMGRELSRSEQASNVTYNETQLDTTSQLLPEFELDFGIPKSAFANLGTTDQERIDAIRIWIGVNGISTSDQYEELAIILGLDVDVIAGWDYELANPGFFFNEKVARNTIVVDMVNEDVGSFTYTFTFTFGKTAIGIMKALFETIKSASTKIIYINE